MLNFQCTRGLTWSPKNADSTNQKQLPAYESAWYGMFDARLHVNVTTRALLRRERTMHSLCH